MSPEMISTRKPCCPGPVHQGADEVVGLEAFLPQGRQPEAVDDLLDIGELHDQLFGHGGPVGLVVGKVAVPLGGPLGVEDQGQVMGLPLLDDLEEHVGHPVGGVGGKTLGSG